MREFQYWAMLRNGDLAFAGVRRLHEANGEAAQGIAGSWLAWVRRYVQDGDDYPTARVFRELPVNPIVAIRLHPVGERDKVVSFQV